MKCNTKQAGEKNKKTNQNGQLRQEGLSTETAPSNKGTQSYNI